MYPQSLQTPPQSLKKITFLIYALHLFSAINGLLSPAFIITTFLSGWPSVIALIMSYIWRDDAEGTFLYSHFQWLIRTFWWALLWMVLGSVLIFTVIGMVIGFPLLLIVGIWVLYRLGYGLYRLNHQQGIV